MHIPYKRGITNLTLNATDIMSCGVMYPFDVIFQVGYDSMVGEGCNISEKVSIKKSILGKHVTIGDKVKITNSVIMDHVTIKEG